MLTSLPLSVPDMPILDYTILMNVQSMAAGMSKEEILYTFSIDKNDFNLDEQIYFDEFYAYGRGIAVHKVVNNLVSATQGKGGTAASMAFLRRFAKEFEHEVSDDTITSGNFSFNFGDKLDGS